MKSVRNGAWWRVFIERLAHEDLRDLVDEFALPLSEAEQALALADPGGSAVEAPWWPEAVRRIVRGEALRAVARAFRTNPRRVRRGLARAAVRVGGENLGEDGVVALAPFRDRLGVEPDGVIAEEAGVLVEAVQGERRRLGIAPFKPEPAELPEPEAVAPRAPRVDELPTRPPRARPSGEGRPRRRSWDAEPVEPTVIRRAPSRARTQSMPRTLPGMGGALPRLASPQRPERDERGPAKARRRRIVRPDREPPEEAEARPTAAAARASTPRASAPRAPAPRASASRATPTLPVASAAAEPSRPSASAVDKPARPPLPTAAAAAGRATTRAARREPVTAPVAAASPSPAPAPAPASAPAAAAPAPVATAASASPPPAPPRPKAPARKRAATTKPARPAPKKRVAAAPASPPPRRRPAPPQPRPTEDRIRARAPRREVASPRTHPAPLPARPAAAPLAPLEAGVAWRVRVRDQELPFVIVAPNADRARSLLADRISAEDLKVATLWQAGELL